MAASPLGTLCTTTIAGWIAAATPETEAARTFRHIGGMRPGASHTVSGDRTFWFDLADSEGEPVIEYALASVLLRWPPVELRCYLDTSALSRTDRLAREANDAKTIITTILKQADSWPSGVRTVVVESLRFERTAEDTTIVVSLHIETQEAT